MSNTCNICLPIVESFVKTMDVGNIEAITNQVGLSWDQVNKLNEFWRKTSDSIRMDILYTAVHELRHHVGTIFELSTKTISALSMINYDGSGIGPVIGGLNGEHLSLSNPFGNQRVSFSQAKSPLIEFATERFKAYKANAVGEKFVNLDVGSNSLHKYIGELVVYSAKLDYPNTAPMSKWYSDI